MQRNLLCLAILLTASPLLGGQLGVQADLIRGVEKRELAIVAAALDKGAKPEAAGAFHRTVLHTAAQQSTSEIIELLLARGADPNARDDDGRTPLHLANSMSAEILLRHGADLNLRDKQGNTVLHTAAEQDGPAMCQLLVGAGAKADVVNNAGLTPLHFVALRGRRSVAEYLLSQGIDLNAKTNAPYSYKWTYVAWDVKGMEEPVPAGQTATSIARGQHRKNKWVSGRYDELAEYLKSKGAVEAKGWWPF